MEDAVLKLRGFWNDPERKPWWRIAYELGRVAWHERELPVHYLTRCLYRRQVTNYLDYSGNRCLNRLDSRLYSSERAAFEIPMLEDKLYFQLLFEKAAIPLPRMLGYNCGVTFYDRTPTTIESPGAFLQVLRGVLDHSANGIVFIKLRHGMQGEGVHRVTAETLGDARTFEALHQDLIKGSYIFQEALQQHPAVSAIYPHSINTIRMDTFVHDDGQAEPLSAFMRFGGDGRHIDNACSGGCFVGIEFQSGCLKTYGHRLLEQGGGVYATHPTTGFRFEGFKIPFFSEAKSLVAQAALVAPANRLVGWDVAIQPGGPALIEGNHNYGVYVQDMAFEGYRRHPTFAQILDRFAS